MKRTLVAKGHPEVTRKTERDYTHAVLVDAVRKNGEWIAGAWSFNGSLELARKQLVKANEAWHEEIKAGNARAYIVEVEEKRV